MLHQACAEQQKDRRRDNTEEKHPFAPQRSGALGCSSCCCVRFHAPSVHDKICAVRNAAPLWGWLLLDARVVDVPMTHNPTVVMLSSLKPLFFHSLTKALRCSANVGV